MSQRITQGGNVFNSADRIINTADAYNVFNQLQTVEYTPIFSRQPLPCYSELRDSLVGAGSVSVVNGELKIDATAGLTTLYTREYGRYLPGVVCLAGIRTRFEPVVGATYRYGYGDSNGNRMGVEHRDGEGWYTFVESSGVRWYERHRSQWIDPLDGTGRSGLNIDLNGATLRLPFGWYGGLSCLFTFAVADRVVGDRTILADSSGGRTDGVLIDQPNLPLFVEATAGGIIYRGGAQFGVFGRYRPQFRITSSPAQELTAVGTTLVPLVSMRVKSATQWRGVPVLLTGESLIADADSQFQIIIDGTINSTTWTAPSGISADETAVELNTDATTISGGYKAAAGIVASGAGRTSGTALIETPDVPIPAGAIVTLAVSTLGAASATVRGILRVREEW